MSITTDDLLDALRDALAKPTVGDASTVYELSKATGYSDNKVRKLLRRIHEEGRLEVVQVQRVNICGTLAPLPGYRAKA